MSALTPSPVASPSKTTVDVTPIKNTHNPYPPCEALPGHKKYYEKMAHDSDLHWIGPKPLENFFADHMPLDEPVPNNLVEKRYFNKIPKTGKEAAMYPALKLIEEAGLLGSSFAVIDTSNYRDPNAYDGTQLRPDVGIFPTADDNANPLAPTASDSESEDVDANSEDLSSDSDSDSSDSGDDENVDDELDDPSFVFPTDQKDDPKIDYSFEKNILPFELKGDNTTPFQDPGDKVQGEARKKYPFQKIRQKDILLRGQLGGVIIQICSRQHRTRTFMVFMNVKEARILYHDRSATIVTEAIKYRHNSQKLAEFLWRFARLTEEQQGIDKTVKQPTDEQRDAAKKALSRWAPKKERPVVVLEVPTEDGKVRDFAVWGAMAEPKALTGRATRACPAYDLEEKKVVFLKDTWRADCEGMEKESDILKGLNAAGVRYVPKFQCGDDIPGTYHSTITQDDIDAEWRAGPIAKLCKRIHHRFTEDFVGNHLDFFKTPKDLMMAINHAVIAHQDAYLNCSILHRDVSGNNVLMSDDGEGILNDWDLAKRIPTKIANPERWAKMSEKEKEADKAKIKTGRRHPYRTGTWYFMSNFVLRYPGKIADLFDDLESFFWVAVFFTIQYLPCAKCDEQLSNLILNVFAQCTHDPETGLYMGGQGKYAALTRMSDSPVRKLEFHNNKPLTKWIKDVLSAFKQLTLFNNSSREDTTDLAISRAEEAGANSDLAITRAQVEFTLPPLPEQIRLRDHQSFLKFFTDVLNEPGWPDNRKKHATVFQPPSTMIQMQVALGLKHKSEGLGMSISKKSVI
ncbi:unnamed protein product [Cyclocybe aegerita]|uniref:Fungal-type protein kinase domain-containing protein n=1 Tax=Cyclocybe aegerita TaxID=1973307 RepID=A0A8S0X6R8_CYCAE|nr:unnamed protein product [Cyclocybe aegerita]